MDQIKPLELRTINHLVNEYLLNHDYKLSSITFSDENEGQVSKKVSLFANLYMFWLDCEGDRFM